MQLKVVATGSSGNCYVLKDTKGKMVILDCGISWKNILAAIDYQIKDVECVCVTHSHVDHAKSLEDVKKHGLKTYTWENEGMKQFGDYRIKAFDLEHDVPCVGFYMKHAEMGSTVYITDTKYCRYVFKNINNMLVECNYEDLSEDRPNYKHVISGHMSLETTKQLVAVNSSPMLQNIVLCHSSALNLDRIKAVEEIKHLGGKANVIVAEPRVELELTEFPF